MKAKKLNLDNFQEKKMSRFKMKFFFGGLTDDMLNNEGTGLDDFPDDYPPTGAGPGGIGITTASLKQYLSSQIVYP